MRLLPRATTALSVVSFLVLGMRGALAGTPPELSKLDALYPSLEALSQDLHRNPELSNHEEKTAAKIAARLRELGFEVTEHVGGHGVVGVLRNGPLSTVLVRTDMDALPIKEQTGLPYASTVTSKNDSGETVPVMHACGHDIHMASWVGAATLLAAAKDRWHGTLAFVGSARRRGREWRADDDQRWTLDAIPKPDFAIAIHDSPTAGSTPRDVRSEQARAHRVTTKIGS